MIEQTKKLVEERYTVANGYPYDAQVIQNKTKVTFFLMKEMFFKGCIW